MTSPTRGQARWPDDSVPVLVEPRSDSSLKAVMEKLQEVGATNIEEAAPGFVAARLPRSCIEQIESIARVSIVTRKAMMRAMLSTKTVIFFPLYSYSYAS